tara:strand:+ start:626 stop:1066 length:441 start_codon:yes stop_codon:yes gene_type:complete
MILVVLLQKQKNIVLTLVMVKLRQINKTTVMRVIHQKRIVEIDGVQHRGLGRISVLQKEKSLFVDGTRWVIHVIIGLVLQVVEHRVLLTAQTGLVQLHSMTITDVREMHIVLQLQEILSLSTERNALRLDLFGIMEHAKQPAPKLS